MRQIEGDMPMKDGRPDWMRWKNKRAQYNDQPSYLPVWQEMAKEISDGWSTVFYNQHLKKYQSVDGRKPPEINPKGCWEVITYGVKGVITTAEWRDDTPLHEAYQVADNRLIDMIGQFYKRDVEAELDEEEKTVDKWEEDKMQRGFEEKRNGLDHSLVKHTGEHETYKIISTSKSKKQNARDARASKINDKRSGKISKKKDKK